MRRIGREPQAWLLIMPMLAIMVVVTGRPRAPGVALGPADDRQRHDVAAHLQPRLWQLERSSPPARPDRPVSILARRSRSHDEHGDTGRCLEELHAGGPDRAGGPADDTPRIVPGRGDRWG